MVMIFTFTVIGCVKNPKKRGSFNSCAECEKLDGFVNPSQINDEIRMMVGKYRGGSGDENVAIQKKRGVIETHLKPSFIDNGICPTIDSEKWAIDYSHKRKAAALHKGIDIPQPRGTAIRAVADGMVVGKFLNRRNKKGIEIVLRHTPLQTGLPFWTYSQYTHLDEMSSLSIGEEVKIGDEIGKTGNSGKMGRHIRRDALHFAILYSTHPQWSNDGKVVTPKDAYFMDPNAFYQKNAPYDSQSLKKLSDEEKLIPIPYINEKGSFIPLDTKRIWPYSCI
jgi:murein DD-endopeptidase MepM/ murein hydrolase activator NlpD